MSEKRNQVDLSTISKKFTEETLKDIFATVCNETDVKITSWDFGTASAKGDSYLSVVDRVTVYGLVKGKPTHVDLVIKSLPKTLGRRKTYRSSEFFRNEIAFYTKVVPKFKQFLKSKNQAHLLSVPNHLGSLADGENDYVVLENVCTLGFGPITRHNCLNMEDCTAILEALATFHAISFAHKDQNKEEFAECVSHLEETYFAPNHWGWYSDFHKRLVNIATNALTIEYPNHEAVKRYTSYKFGSLYDKCCDFCNRTDAPTSVVSQGDSWAPNIFVRAAEGKKRDALLLDFQLAHCVSPVCDLSFCIYSCTDKALREHFHELLKIYHNKLSNVIASLGSDPQKLYSWEKFMEEVKEQFIYGVVFAMEALPVAMLDESEVYDLDEIIKGDEAVNIDDVWALPHLKTSEKRRRLADVIVHAAENGFL